MSRMWWVRGRNALLRRRRHVLVLAVLAGGALWMTVQAWRSEQRDGQTFLGDLYLNIGAALIMTLLTYLVLNPLFRELQTATIIEHPRLDRDALIQRVGQSREIVAILETFTSMLEGPYTTRFLVALRFALANGAVVKVLLLDPDSPAVRLRAEELRRADTALAINNNLYHFGKLQQQLTPAARSRLQVRLYATAPSVQMYRWDHKAFISFFPVTGKTFDAQQLEAFVSTPLGEFVEDRFTELWETAPLPDLDACLTLRVCLWHSGTELESCEARYVRVDGTWFISGADLVRNVARHGLSGLSVVLDRPEVAGEAFTLGEADELEPPEVYHRALQLFRAKYGLDAGEDTENQVIFNLVTTTTLSRQRA
ncbi:hypothetical protein ACL02O_11335 [Micromonospora sp. MS34]|uniref:hypothetical protein n=1 Tax=Micromonospora sp. MS34 TaxID=3385971 RepID=UPI0039A14A49